MSRFKNASCLVLGGPLMFPVKSPILCPIAVRPSVLPQQLHVNIDRNLEITIMNFLGDTGYLSVTGKDVNDEILCM